MRKQGRSEVAWKRPCLWRDGKLEYATPLIPGPINFTSFGEQILNACILKVRDRRD